MIENEYSSLEKLARNLEFINHNPSNQQMKFHNVGLLVAVIILTIFQSLIQSVKLYK